MGGHGPPKPCCSSAPLCELHQSHYVSIIQLILFNPILLLPFAFWPWFFNKKSNIKLSQNLIFDLRIFLKLYYERKTFSTSHFDHRLFQNHILSPKTQKFNIGCYISIKFWTTKKYLIFEIQFGLNFYDDDLLKITPTN